MSEEELMIEHNKMIIKILQQCDHILENRCYLNEIGIKNTVTEIKDIAKHFYIEEPQWRNNDKEKQKIIDLENEISFLKNALYEKQKEIEELKKEIKKLTRLNSAYKTNYDSKVLKEERKNKKILEGYISKDKIRKIIYGNYEDLEIILLIKKLLEG